MCVTLRTQKIQPPHMESAAKLTGSCDRTALVAHLCCREKLSYAYLSFVPLKSEVYLSFCSLKLKLTRFKNFRPFVIYLDKLQ